MARPKSTVPVVFATSLTYNPASVDAYNSRTYTVTVNDLRLGYPVQMWAASLEAGLVLSNVYCSAANTLKFTLYNSTGVLIDPASQVFQIVQR